MSRRKIIFCVILSLSVIAGLLIIKKLAVPVEAEQTYFFETPEYQLAKKLANSKVKMNCYEFALLWQTIFPDAHCYKLRVGKYQHWQCDLTDKLIVDANFDWKKTIQIRKK